MFRERARAGRIEIHDHDGRATSCQRARRMNDRRPGQRRLAVEDSLVVIGFMRTMRVTFLTLSGALVGSEVPLGRWFEQHVIADSVAGTRKMR